MKCAICKLDDDVDEMFVDHILPRSNPEYHDADNIRFMHRICHRRQSKWYWRLWYSFLRWLDSFEPCGKERAGYTCHHRVMSNGKKECGN